MSDALGQRVRSLSISSIESSDIEDLRLDISRAVRSVCPRWLAEHADDLTQIAIARILDRLHRADGELALTTGYLYRTAYSVVVDEIRRRRRLNETSLEPDVAVHANQRDPEHQTFGREVRDAIAESLATLAPPRRRAVTLHLMGHSVDEISALLECRRKQAENLVYRGLKDLRTLLTKRGVNA